MKHSSPEHNRASFMLHRSNSVVLGHYIGQLTDYVIVDTCEVNERTHFDLTCPLLSHFFGLFSEFHQFSPGLFQSIFYWFFTILLKQNVKSMLDFHLFIFNTCYLLSVLSVSSYFHDYCFFPCRVAYQQFCTCVKKKKDFNGNVSLYWLQKMVVEKVVIRLMES